MRRNAPYIHALPDWPKFHWDQTRLASTLAAVRHQQGRLIGRMEALGFPLQQEATLQALTEETVKSSEIEGERLDTAQVRSSIARRLGMDVGGVDVVDGRIEGVVEMMLDATGNYDQPLTAERLFGWHASLFPTGRSGMRKVRAGAWRDDSTGPMQVVSGPAGRERIHFEGPAAKRLDRDMRTFLRWFNEGTGPAVLDDVLKAGLAHLWFVTIHPFDDGNGRIARAIADLALARSENSAQRFYSMSAQIRRERNDYYGILERTQKGTLDVTPWMEWCLGSLGRAIDGAQTTLAAVLRKAGFWQALRDVPINERQRLILNRLLDGFEGKLTSSKWAAIANCSSDTALRDILDLVERGVLVRNPGAGRSTSYSLADIRSGRAAGRRLIGHP
ncbi:MAG TPA: Fic family protein [Vicinamibacterales bacterium]